MGRGPVRITGAHSLGNRSRRQVTRSLVRHHVGGIPGGPVLVLARPVKKVRPPRALLVLDMGGFGTPKGALQVWRGRECRSRRVDPAWEPRGDLLDKPRIAVGVLEREERPI